RGVEVVCESLEELDALIARYGDAATPGRPGPAKAGRNGTGPADVDVALLRLLARSPSGVVSKTIEGMLQVQGKAIRTALRAWAVRVNLSPDTIEKANPGGRRGWRLTEGGMGAAKALMAG